MGVFCLLFLDAAWTNKSSLQLKKKKDYLKESCWNLPCVDVCGWAPQVSTWTCLVRSEAVLSLSRKSYVWSWKNDFSYYRTAVNQLYQISHLRVVITSKAVLCLAITVTSFLFFVFVFLINCSSDVWSAFPARAAPLVACVTKGCFRTATCTHGRTGPCFEHSVTDCHRVAGTWPLRGLEGAAWQARAPCTLRCLYFGVRGVTVFCTT